MILFYRYKKILFQSYEQLEFIDLCWGWVEREGSYRQCIELQITLDRLLRLAMELNHSLGAGFPTKDANLPF